MKRLAVIVACVFACLLWADRAHLKSSEYSRGFLAKTHDKTNPVEAPPAAQVCVLDPTLHVPEPDEASKVSTDAPPAAVVPETVFDFGKLTEDLEFVHRFSVKNTGKSVLNIKKVVPG
ncbi:MAG: hypothetical protein ABFD97_25150 [Syntrophobacter sp.]